MDLRFLARVGLERDGHQLQADRPAVRIVVDGVRQLHVDAVVQIGLEEGQGLVEIKAKIGSADLTELGHRAQPPEFQIGIDT
ncbi:hypothetical protein D3C72_2419330 [compost metagenome]